MRQAAALLMLDGAGMAFLILAGWTVYPALGMALLGVACLVTAWRLERTTS